MSGLKLLNLLFRYKLLDRIDLTLYNYCQKIFKILLSKFKTCVSKILQKLTSNNS